MSNSEIIATSFALRLFGPFAAFTDGRPLPPLRSRKGFWILALLALRRRPADRSWLAGTLWPDSPESQALFYLRRELLDLRRALGSEARRLLSTRTTLTLDLSDADIDLLDFDDAVTRDDPPSLARAVALYRGPLLEGCDEEWVFPERAARETAYLRAAETLAKSALEAGDFPEAELLLRRAIATDPLKESLWGGMMEAQAGRGDYAEMTATYRSLRERLRDEMNVEPSAGIRHLHERLREKGRTARVSPRYSPMIEPVGHAAPPKVTALPKPLSSFIGREKEISEIRSLIASSRLVTLAGAGGIGKTSLVLQIARRLQAERPEDYPDGIWMVELAPLAESDRVIGMVASALDVMEDRRPLLQTLIEFLRPKRMLIVLDNCEHLIEACASLSERLLQGVDGLKILATSREALKIPGETTYRVPSLSMPVEKERIRPEDLLESEASRLFVDRARAHDPGFKLTAENAPALVRICVRLDGIPLALELAAARVRMMTIERIDKRLEDRFALLVRGNRTALPRHQTLRALMDWSYDLLTGGERTLLHRLSVFAGGWTLEAAEAVCAGEGMESWEVSEGLMALVEKSIATYEEKEGCGRYKLLETIRQYALEKLRQNGEEKEIQRRHRDYYLVKMEDDRSFVRSHDIEWLIFLTMIIRGGSDDRVDDREWMSELEIEYQNVLQALEWSLADEGSGEESLRLAETLFHFWYRRSRINEGYGYLKAALAHPGAQSPSILRAKVAYNAQYTDNWLARPREAHRWALEAQRILSEIGEVESWLGLAVLVIEGESLICSGDFDESRKYLHEALDLSKRKRYWEIPPIALIGLSYFWEDRYELAWQWWERAYEMERALDLKTESRAVIYTGITACYLGRYDLARSRLEQATMWNRVNPERKWVTPILSGWAVLALKEGRFRRSAILFSFVDTWYKENRITCPNFVLDRIESHLTEIRAALNGEEFEAAWRGGQALSLEEAFASVLSE